MENLTGGTPPVRYLLCVVPCKLYFGQGETTAEAVNELEGNEFEWLETAKQCGIPIPDMHVRTDSPQYSGKISLRFSPFVHEQASDLAKKQGDQS